MMLDALKRDRMQAYVDLIKAQFRYNSTCMEVNTILGMLVPEDLCVQRGDIVGKENS